MGPLPALEPGSCPHLSTLHLSPGARLFWGWQDPGGTASAPAGLRPDANAGHEVKMFSVQKGRARCSHMSGGTCPGPAQQTRKAAGGVGRTQGSSAGAYSLPWCPQEDPGPVSERGGLSAPSSQSLGAHKGTHHTPAPTSSQKPLIPQGPSFSVTRLLACPGAHLLGKISSVLPTLFSLEQAHHLCPVLTAAWSVVSFPSQIHILLTYRADHVTALL